MNLRREDLTQIRLSNRHVRLPLREAPCGLPRERAWSLLLFWLDEGNGFPRGSFVRGCLGFSPVGETGEGFVFDLTPSPSPSRRGGRAATKLVTLYFIEGCGVIGKDIFGERCVEGNLGHVAIGVRASDGRIFAQHAIRWDWNFPN